MNRQNLYVMLLNSIFGVGMSLLFKGSLLIFILSCIVVVTILFLERRPIYEKVLRQKRWAAGAAAGVVVLCMISGYFLITKPDRETASIVASVAAYLDAIKAGDYGAAYGDLSQVSKEAYPLERFEQDHRGQAAKVQDFRIDEVEFNKYDKRKAVVRISSPFLIYGQSSVPLEMAKEGSDWKVVWSASMMKGSAPANLGERATAVPPPKKQGKVSHFFKTLF
jgi:hypothetical protein